MMKRHEQHPYLHLPTRTNKVRTGNPFEKPYLFETEGKG
jgi:hypothetical protein